MSNKSLKVCYVIYSEEIWSPLLKRQVLELLQIAAGSNEHLQIRLLYIFPWYWKLLKKQHLKEFAKEFATAPIELRFMPVLFPFPLPYFLPKYIKGLGFRPYEPDSSVFFWVVKLLILPILLKYAIIDNFKIFHGRSYPATAIILLAKKLYPKLKVIFDPRSDYPEENILQSSWSRTSHTFKFWKKQEQQLLKNSSVTICISKFYQQHYQRFCNNYTSKIIPNNVDCVKFKFNYSARESIRHQYNLKNKIVFCFLGSMRVGGWHCPYVYSKLIIAFRTIKSPHLFLFLVAENSRKDIEKIFYEGGIKSSEYLIISPDYAEVPQYLSAADFGLLYLEKEKIALGTKAVEYNAVGLPILVNSNVISAAGYVKKYKTGLVVNIGLGDLDQEKTPLHHINFSDLGRAYKRDKIAQTATALFSNRKVAEEYVQLYYSLAN